MLRAYEFVENRHRSKSVNRDLAITWTRPSDSQCVAALAEKPLDVLGLVAEGIARSTPDVGALALRGDDSSSVAMDQAPEERPPLRSNDLRLPRHQGDRPKVLSPWTVLGDETWPVF